MTHDRSEGYAGKHPTSTSIDESLAGALRESVVDGQISCAAAHALAEDLAQQPANIGRTMDLMDIRLIRCQLGLFGYQPEKRIVTKAQEWDEGIEKDIRGALQNGRLPCAQAWSIARRWQMPRRRVANICEALAIKIKPCQLGAF